jgi:hypothetical protein
VPNFDRSFSLTRHSTCSILRAAKGKFLVRISNNTCDSG